MYGRYVHMHSYSTCRSAAVRIPNGICGYSGKDIFRVETGSRVTEHDMEMIKSGSIIFFSMKKIMIAGIRFYQKYLSPLKTTRCPYIPSCSAYGLEAIQKYGAWKGGWMALWRIMRCNPFSHGGYDPVP